MSSTDRDPEYDDDLYGDPVDDEEFYDDEDEGGGPNWPVLIGAVVLFLIGGGIGGLVGYNMGFGAGQESRIAAGGVPVVEGSAGIDGKTEVAAGEPVRDRAADIQAAGGETRQPSRAVTETEEPIDLAARRDDEPEPLGIDGDASADSPGGAGSDTMPGRPMTGDGSGTTGGRTSGATTGGGDGRDGMAEPLFGDGETDVGLREPEDAQPVEPGDGDRALLPSGNITVPRPSQSLRGNNDGPATSPSGDETKRAEAGAPAESVNRAVPGRDTIERTVPQPETTERQTAERQTGQTDESAPAQPEAADRSAPAASEPARAQAAPSGDFVVQVAALGSQQEADNAWEILTARFPSLLDPFVQDTQRADTSRGTFYRLRIGYFDSRGAASSLCDELKAEGQDCLVRGR